LNTIIAHAALCSDVKLWLFDGKIVELGLWRPVLHSQIFVSLDRVPR
jgi:S-DNA-T family DNA segregation ATPase FtsK/SpoIIIE